MQLATQRIFLLLSLSALTAKGADTPAISPPAGRVAVVADGNSPDPDDIFATAVGLALIKAAGAEKKLVHYSHSCDLVKGPKITAEKELERQGMMQRSCDETAKLWGGFDHLTFYNCRTQYDAARKDLTDHINASNETNPLWIIEQGEPDLIYDAVAAADRQKLAFIHFITHHPMNDQGDHHDLKDILKLGGHEVRISNQNKNLRGAIEPWFWMRDSEDPKIRWLWDQGMLVEKDTVVDFQKGVFDCSDAGMVYFWLSGASQGGSQTAGPEEVRSLLLKNSN